MKKENFRLIPFLIFITQFAFGQEIAVTERGDSIILFSNKTWEYKNNYDTDSLGSLTIKMNTSSFNKPLTSTKKVNGINNAYEIWYNQKDWKIIPAKTLNPKADVALQLLKGDAYAMLLYEEIEIPIENLSQIAFDNAIKVASDMEMIDREYRVVNNKKLIWMRMDGTVQGMKISYYSYYYSNNKGSIQFLTFTGQNVINKYENVIEDILNGLIINE